MKTSIRIEVPDTLYEQLVLKQEKRRQSTGRKPSLASLILGFCENGVSDKKSQEDSVHLEQKNVRREQKNVQNNVHPEQKNDQNNVRHEQNHNNSLQETGIEKHFKHWEDHLSRWETTLRERESFLNEKEKELFEQKEEVYQLKTDLLEQKDKFRQETLAGPEEVIETRMQAYDLENKNKRIAELEESLKEAKMNFNKALKNAEEQKETQPSFWDNIKQYLPVILGGATLIGLYLMNRNKDKPKLDPQLEKIIKTLDKLDPTGKESLGKAILDFVDNYQKDNPTKKKSDQ